jgi:hypothetical protein
MRYMPLVRFDMGRIHQSIATHFCVPSAKEARYEPYHLHLMKCTGKNKAKQQAEAGALLVVWADKFSRHGLVMTISATQFRCLGIMV